MQLIMITQVQTQLQNLFYFIIFILFILHKTHQSYPILYLNNKQLLIVTLLHFHLKTCAGLCDRRTGHATLEDLRRVIEEVGEIQNENLLQRNDFWVILMLMDLFDRINSITC